MKLCVFGINRIEVFGYIFRAGWYICGINIHRRRDAGVAKTFLDVFGMPPAVLIELAFIDNMEDAWLLTNYPDEFARAVACGVTDYEKQKTDE